MLNKLLKKYAKNEEGLTLIELLVVIVILGIIAAIAVVSIGGIIGNTKDKAKVTEAVQIINAAKLKHSAEGKYSGTTGWVSSATVNPFKGYLSDYKDAVWTVTVDADGKYYITGHDSASVILSTNTDATVVPESNLTNYLDGE
ncbi:type II secretion system protein [Fictibacillus nanhaiensis]|uniref:Type II secretion system protein n=1 Tax=Fictibacillus nanhaiensis TaxID=742169 RepID=A0ABS2ZS56_9BACL|nr:type II secretion system protein [Fictibacillus nanhaiensis]